MSSFLSVDHAGTWRLTSAPHRHGRDNKLVVWQLGVADEDGMEKTLPVNCTFPVLIPKHPWLLHSLTVNTLNFCSFAMCYDALSASLEANDRARPILLAIPNTINSGGVCPSRPQYYDPKCNRCRRLMSSSYHQSNVSQSYKARGAQTLVRGDRVQTVYPHDVYVSQAWSWPWALSRKAVGCKFLQATKAGTQWSSSRATQALRGRWST